MKHHRKSVGDQVDMTGLTDEMLDQLCYAATNLSGEYDFPTWMTHHEELARQGLIEIYKPVDSKTGKHAPEYQWSFYVTEKGMKVVRANPDMMY